MAKQQNWKADMQAELKAACDGVDRSTEQAAVAIMGRLKQKARDLAHEMAASSKQPHAREVARERLKSGDFDLTVATAPTTRSAAVIQNDIIVNAEMIKEQQPIVERASLELSMAITNAAAPVVRRFIIARLLSAKELERDAIEAHGVAMQIVQKNGGEIVSINMHGMHSETADSALIF